jgi:hypothetical protein
MPGQKQLKMVDLVSRILGCKPKKESFSWLINVPLRENFGKYFDGINKIYSSLGGDNKVLDEIRLTSICRKLTPDAFFPYPYEFIFEFDELQHFTQYKLIALHNYPNDLVYGFNRESYIKYCNKYAENAIRKGAGGYRRPTKEFPFNNGRAAQRAFFDAFRDIQPTLYGLKPTVRISEFDVSEQFTEKEVERVLMERFKAIGVRI